VAAQSGSKRVFWALALLVSGCSDPIEGLVEPSLIGMSAVELRQRRPRIPGLTDVPAGQQRRFDEPLANSLFASASWHFDGPKLERCGIRIAPGSAEGVQLRLMKKFGKPTEYKSSTTGATGYRWEFEGGVKLSLTLFAGQADLEFGKGPTESSDEDVFSFRPIIELFALLTDEAAADWTWDEMTRRRIAASGGRESEDFRRLCPEGAESPEDFDGDEFERRERERQRSKAGDACVERLKRDVAKTRKEIWVADVPIVGREEYDFGRSEFMLLPATYRHQAEGMKASGWGMGVVSGVPPILLLGHRVEPKMCGPLGTPLIDEGTIFAVEGASSEAIISSDTKRPQIRLRIPEKEARAAAKRLDRFRVSALRLQVAFDLHGYGDLPIGCAGTPLRGFRGRAVGYRVLDDGGELEPWTMFRAE